MRSRAKSRIEFERGTKLKHELRSITGNPLANEVWALAQSGDEAAVARLQGYSAQQLADSVLGVPMQRRAGLLELLDRVDEIVPLLPEAEFTSTVRATGIEDAGWLVEFATSEQRVAAVDLDCWRNLRLSPSRLFEWIDAMIEAGPETLLSAFDELDLELWVLAMKEMADFQVGAGEESGLMTDDGVVFFDPHSAEHEDRLHAILSTARDESPRHYWGFVYGAVLGSRRESEQYAARWQRGRLNDLGFPDRDQAMRAYRPLAPETVPVPAAPLGEDPNGPRTRRSQAPAMLEGTLLGLAMGALPAERASEVFSFVLGVANSLAVADDLDLANTDSLQQSLSKAIRGIEGGLAALHERHGRPVGELLDAVAPLDLFRVGASLDPELGRSQTASKFHYEEKLDDWNVETETLDAEDQTVGLDGRLR